VLAVLMYVLMDGWDLGVGILFLVAPRDQERDNMMESIVPFWDGNETWLVFGGGAGAAKDARTRTGGASSGVAEGMSEKMLDAIRGANTAGARALQDSAFYGDERAILNDACGWSDEPIGL
jgi:hypothetical protein